MPPSRKQQTRDFDGGIAVGNRFIRKPHESRAAIFFSGSTANTSAQ